MELCEKDARDSSVCEEGNLQRPSPSGEQSEHKSWSEIQRDIRHEISCQKMLQDDDEEEEETDSSEEEGSSPNSKGSPPHKNAHSTEPSSYGSSQRPPLRPGLSSKAEAKSNARVGNAATPVPPQVPRPPSGSRTARPGSRPASGKSASSTGSTPEPLEVLEGGDEWQVEMVGERNRDESQETKELKQRMVASETSLKIERERRLAAEKLVEQLKAQVAQLQQAGGAHSDDNLMDVGCQTVPVTAEAENVKAKHSQGIEEFQARSEALEIENDALERKLKQVEGDLERLRADNKFLWGEQSTLSTLREENGELKTQLEALRSSKKHTISVLEQWQASKERPQTAMSRMGTQRTNSPLEGEPDLHTKWSGRGLSGSTFMTAPALDDGAEDDSQGSSIASSQRPKSAVAKYRDSVGDYHRGIEKLQQRWLPSSNKSKATDQTARPQPAAAVQSEDYSLAVEDDSD